VNGGTMSVGWDGVSEKKHFVRNYVQDEYLALVGQKSSVLGNTSGVSPLILKCVRKHGGDRRQRGVIRRGRPECMYFHGMCFDAIVETLMHKIGVKRLFQEMRERNCGSCVVRELRVKLWCDVVRGLSAFKNDMRVKCQPLFDLVLAMWEKGYCLSSAGDVFMYLATYGIHEEDQLRQLMYHVEQCDKRMNGGMCGKRCADCDYGDGELDPELDAESEARACEEGQPLRKRRVIDE
jgi:hypothetical protein